MTESEHRQQVVKEALSWVDTPYHLHADVKGSGADCATVIMGTYAACGLYDQTNHDILASDWWMHPGSNMEYLRGLMKFCTRGLEGICYKSMKALPGNVVTAERIDSKRINHGGVIIEWPMIVHAVSPVVCLVDVSRNPMWINKHVSIWDPWLKLATETA